MGLRLAQLRLPRSSIRALNETLAPHLENKTGPYTDRQLPAQPYHAQISPIYQPALSPNTHVLGVNTVESVKVVKVNCSVTIRKHLQMY